MIVRLLLAVLVTVFVIAVMRLLWLQSGKAPGATSASPSSGSARQGSPLLGAALVLLVALLLVLVIMGRLHWLIAIPAALLALARRALGLAPLLAWLRGRMTTPSAATGATPPGGASSVRSRFLRMDLDLASGEIDGEVLEGDAAGSRLGDLALTDLLALLARYRREDADSARLLEAYLDRQHGPGWRADADDAGTAAPPSDDSTLSRTEALEILGLGPDADAAQITAAHRRLMQKFHPDRGGSAYLAARINAARDLLLDKSG